MFYSYWRQRIVGIVKGVRFARNSKLNINEKYTNWAGVISTMSSERAFVGFSLKFTKYVWFLLYNSRSKSTTNAFKLWYKSYNNNQPAARRFHILLENSYALKTYTLTQGGTICLLSTLWPTYIHSGNQAYTKRHSYTDLLFGCTHVFLYFLLMTSHISAHTGNLDSVGFGK